MIATFLYVEHWKDIRSKTKQTMQNKFFRFVDSTDLQTLQVQARLISLLQALTEVNKKEET